MRRWFLVLLCHSVALADKGSPASPICEPSRACAIELALAAGRENHKATGNLVSYSMGLISLALLQLDAGDSGVTHTLAELRKAIDEDPPSRKEEGLYADLAALQARAGLFEQAIDTAVAIRDPETRMRALRWVTVRLAEGGRWREALAVAGRFKRGPREASAGWDVMSSLIETGRRDWVAQAAPTLTPGEEGIALARVALVNGDFDTARREALRITDVDRRLSLIGEIGSAAEDREHRAELAAAARLLAANADKASSETMRDLDFEVAAEWLIQAGELDEAATLLPRLPADEQPSKRGDIAIALAHTGEYRKARALLSSGNAAYRREILAAIETGKTLVGDANLDAMSKISDRETRFVELEFLGEHLPDARSEEARTALREATRLAQGPGIEQRETRLAFLAEMQAKRGYFEDAHATALLVTDTGELLGAYGAIGIAQAKRGLMDDARKTFTIAERQARKHGFPAEQHAWLIESLAEAGLLPEAAAQVKALCGRNADDYYFDRSLDPVIVKLIEAGQLPRAFEIATMLSDHRSGAPHYFLVIAEHLGGVPGRTAR